MKIGFRIPYSRCDATFMGLRVGKLALDLGFDIEIYPTDKPTYTHAFWDRYLVRPGKAPLNEWLQCNLTQIIYTKPPALDELQSTAHLKIRTNLVLLWDLLVPTDDQLLGRFDRIICPARAPMQLLQKRLGLRNLFYIPWDTGVPISYEPRDLDPARLGIIWPLNDSQTYRQDPKFLQVASMLLEQVPSAWLTITYSNGLAHEPLRELRKLAQFADGRVELIRNLSLDKQDLLFGYHDLTVWPALIEAAGLVGLTSLSMAAPVLAFDYPIIGEIIKSGRNGELVPCDLSASPTGVPSVVPDYPLFGKHLVDLARDTQHLSQLRQDAMAGLRERRTGFMTKWQTLLYGSKLN